MGKVNQSVVAKTAILGMEILFKEGKFARNIRGPCISGHFNGMLVQWWEMFGLHGDGLAIGDGTRCQAVKQTLKSQFPEIGTIQVVDLKEADIIWDITTETPSELVASQDWVICQAVLEHVVDPFCAIKYLLKTLKPDKHLYVHTVGPEFKVHRRPVDCLRFLSDFFKLTAENLGVTLVDYARYRPHHVAIYKQRSANEDHNPGDEVKEK